MRDISRFREVVQRQDVLSDEIERIKLWIDNDWNEILLLQKEIDKTELNAIDLPKVDNYVQ